MNEIQIKAENQGEEILLYYMDENGIEQSMVTSVTVDNNGGHQVVQQIVPEIQDQSNQMEIIEYAADNHYIEQQISPKEFVSDTWTEKETKQLLIFYIDNKETFRAGKTNKKHLWTVACKAMLHQKNAFHCEMKLHEMKMKYIQVRSGSGGCQFYELCNKAFYDDEVVIESQAKVNTELVEVTVGPIKTINEEGIVIIKKHDATKPAPDEKVVAMLKLYIEHKNSMRHVPKELWQKGLWESIATQLGDGDPDYWHRRFMNFKQNYIRLLDKRQESGAESITWPYIRYFDEIFKDDAEFKKRYLSSTLVEIDIKPTVLQEPEWDVTEMTVLAKYVFDCFGEFCDPTIPKKFLWSEVGRLLDRNAELCEIKYQDMKAKHLRHFNDGSYDLKNRLPLAIILDNIISKEVALELESSEEKLEDWKTSEIDVLVQFVYENIEMLKDPICLYVCWARLGEKLSRSAFDCKNQWDILVALYDSILKDKKDDPEMEIDWRYIDMFDRIFDYGTGEEFLSSFRKTVVESICDKDKEADKSAKECPSSKEDDDVPDEEISGRNGNSLKATKAFKILEYYHSHQELFQSAKRNKTSNWQEVAKQIKMSPAQCAHRFRNLKQVYMSYLNRECKRPDKPITWPYYDLCKKVFGYGTLKGKIEKKTDSDYNAKDWSTGDINFLIEYFGQNFVKISQDFMKSDCWTELAEYLNKDEESCRAKFLELRKSYRKLKTMLNRNPQTKVSWKYFNHMDSIYTTGSIEALKDYEMMDLDDDIKKEIQDDDDIQCIIVVPEGQTIEDVLMQTKKQENENQTKPKWTMKTKKQLLRHYLKYIQSRQGQIIDSAEMWKEISSNFKDKTPIMCRRMFLKLKHRRIMGEKLNEESIGSAYHSLLDGILSLKPKFVKKDVKITDVTLSEEKTDQILNYYYEHLDEFLSPKFEKKKIWHELATHVNESMLKVYKKVKFLKQAFCKEPENCELPFYNSLKMIFDKQKVVKQKILSETNTPAPDFSANDNDWTEAQLEQLLNWYLEHLEKFKNSKYISSYLWKDASNVLEKSPLACSKKMIEIRKEYKNKIKTPAELNAWKFADLCQKIYGTGKKI